MKEQTPQEQIKALEDAAFSRGKAEGRAEEGKDIGIALRDALNQGRLEGADSERARIEAVEAAGAGMPGHEKLIQELKYDGKTTGQEASQKILAAEKASREARLANIRAAAPNPVPHAAAPAAAPAEKESAYNPVTIARKARQYRTEMDQKGVKISAREATDHVLEAEGLKVGTEPVSAPSGA